MPRPKGPETKRINLTLGNNVIALLRAIRVAKPGYTMTKAIQEAIEAWLEKIEGEEAVVDQPNGYKLIKPPGMPYPPRPTTIQRQGRPPGGRPSSETTNTTTKITEPVFERFENAIFGLNAWRSYAVEEALLEWFDAQLPQAHPLRAHLNPQDMQDSRHGST